MNQSDRPSWIRPISVGVRPGYALEKGQTGANIDADLTIGEGQIGRPGVAVTPE